MTWCRAASADELWIGEMRAATLGGRPVLLVNVEGQVRAFEDRCAHQGIPLSRGQLASGILTCGAHEWQYEAATGRCLNPCGITLRTFPVEVRDGQIWVDVIAPERR
jgi:nitrite reductase/ring-hydroxylating ferredoxin subunit